MAQAQRVAQAQSFSFARQPPSLVMNRRGGYTGAGCRHESLKWAYDYRVVMANRACWVLGRPVADFSTRKPAGARAWPMLWEGGML